MKKYNDLTPEEQEALHQQFLKEPDAFYQKAEMDLLKKALRENYKERFLSMTRLMKLQLMISKAKISHSKLPDNPTT